MDSRSILYLNIFFVYLNEVKIESTLLLFYYFLSMINNNHFSLDKFTYETAIFTPSSSLQLEIYI